MLWAKHVIRFLLLNNTLIYLFPLLALNTNHLGRDLSAMLTQGQFWMISILFIFCLINLLGYLACIARFTCFACLIVFFFIIKLDWILYRLYFELRHVCSRCLLVFLRLYLELEWRLNHWVQRFTFLLFTSLQRC